MRVFLNITDPKIVYGKNTKRVSGVKPGAPGPPCGRFGVNWGIDTGEEVLSWRNDGCMVLYQSATDECIWVPPRTFYGGGYKKISHPGARVSFYVEQALGFPRANEGWDDFESDDPVVKAAQKRVADGLYKQVLDLSRAWRAEWVEEEITRRVVEKERLIDEIGEFVEGND